MFDAITFRYRIPNGINKDDYQCKELNCNGDFYEITSCGCQLREQESGERFDIEFDGWLSMTASRCSLL